MKNGARCLLQSCFTLLVALSILGSVAVQAAGASDFGPFQGKIVNAETKEPIEGVVVLFEWWQIHPYRGGSSFFDAQETITDNNGEFYIPGVWSLNPLVWIRTEAHVTFYKSGYGLPDHFIWAPYINGRYEPDRYILGVARRFQGLWKGLLEVEWGAKKGAFIWKYEEDKPVFMLKQMNTKEERQKSIPHEPSVPSGEYSRLSPKWKLLKQEIEKEEALLKAFSKSRKR